MEGSSAGRLVGVLVAPGKTFRSIAERPTWFVAFVVLLLSSAAVTLLMLQRVDMAEAMREQLAAQGRSVEELPEGMGSMMVGCGIASAFGFALLFFFGVPAVLLLFNLFGGQLNYRTSLAVALHAMMPWVVASLLSIPVILSRGSLTMEEMQSGSVLKSNLAFLAPEGAAPVLVALLSSIDVFHIWVVVLMVLGYHIAARVSKATAALVIGLSWLLLILLRVGVAALGAMQGA